MTYLFLGTILLTTGFWVELVRERLAKRDPGPLKWPVIGLCGLAFLIPNIWMFLPGQRLLLLLTPIPVICSAPRVKWDLIRAVCIAATILFEICGFVVSVASAVDPWGGVDVQWRASSPDALYEAMILEDFDHRWLELRPTSLNLGTLLDWPSVRVPQPSYVNLKWMRWEDNERLSVGYHPADGNETFHLRWRGVRLRYVPALNPLRKEPRSKSLGSDPASAGP